jgi:hypothetical protein
MFLISRRKEVGPGIQELRPGLAQQLATKLGGKSTRQYRMKM